MSRSVDRRVAQFASRWELALQTRFPLTPGSYGNYVTAAHRPDGTRCVLKVSSNIADTRTEIRALEIWDGRGAARLLAADPERGALLLEMVEPGTMLADEASDEATRIAAAVLRELWLSDSTTTGLRSLESWCGAFDRNRGDLLRGVDGFPVSLFDRADHLRAELLDSTRGPVVLHGDLHHFNVLRSDRAGWLAIDPKGLLGDRCFDVCQFLRNPAPVPLEANRRRLDVLCDELGLDRLRARAWCVVHAVLDACWSFEQGQPLADGVTYAQQTLLF
jgi:streptomycin 6-kinase